MSAFGARPNGNTVILDWSTATETNNFGFDVERSDKSRAAWTRVGFMDGQGSTNAPHSYSFTDITASGNVVYRLKQIDRDGNFEYSKEVEVTAASGPAVFALQQNFPNPFNPSTTLRFTVPSAGRATLKIFNALGQEVATLFDRVAQAGLDNQVQFDATGLASGYYIARLESNGKTQLMKMSVIK